MRLTEIKGFVVYDIYEGVVLQRGRMHNRSMAAKINFLDHYNISTIVSLAPKKIDPDYQELASAGELNYIHYPIPDGLLKDPTIAWMEQIAVELAKGIKDTGMAVLAHCNAGRNRSGLLNALIIRELSGCSGVEAMDIVRKERPNAIANDHFENYLTSLDVAAGDDIMLIVLAGAGAAGKTTTTQAYAEGEPDEHKEIVDLPTMRGVRPMGVNWTVYDNCAVIGNHRNGTDSNTGPATVRESFSRCIDSGMDVIILDGYTSSPQWAQMCAEWQDDNPERYMGVLLVHFNLTVPDILGRLAQRRGVHIDTLQSEKRVKWATGGARRPILLIQHFDNWCADQIFDTLVITESMDTECIIDMMDEAVDEFFEVEEA